MWDAEGKNDSIIGDCEAAEVLDRSVSTFSASDENDEGEYIPADAKDKKDGYDVAIQKENEVLKI